MGSKVKDLSGIRFGQLTVLNEFYRAGPSTFWKCLCDCGKEKWIRGNSLTEKDTKSCGHRVPNNFEIIVDEKGSYVLVELNRGQWASCDIDDWFYNLEKHRWSASKEENGYYARSQTDNRSFGMSSIILNTTEEFREVDHVDRNPLNNRRYNLRLCTRQQNMYNTGKRKSNKSGYIGVHFSLGKWHAQARLNGNKTYLGRFDDIIEAAKTVDLYRIKHHKEFCGELNFPHLMEEYFKTLE